MKWRKKEWIETVYSIVTITLTTIEEGNIDVKMTQTGVPIQDAYKNPTIVENTENGWKELIFGRISKVLGYTCNDV